MPTFTVTSRTDTVTGASVLTVGGKKILPTQISMRELPGSDVEIVISGPVIRKDGTPGQQSKEIRYLTHNGAWLLDVPPGWAASWLGRVRDLSAFASAEAT